MHKIYHNKQVNVELLFNTQLKISYTKMFIIRLCIRLTCTIVLRRITEDALYFHEEYQRAHTVSTTICNIFKFINTCHLLVYCPPFWFIRICNILCNTFQLYLKGSNNNACRSYIKRIAQICSFANCLKNRPNYLNCHSVSRLTNMPQELELGTMGSIGGPYIAFSLWATL